MIHPPRKILAMAALVLSGLFMVPLAAGAQSLDSAVTAGSDLVDFRVLAVVPILVVLLSTVLVRSGASDAVKQAVPFAVTAVLIVAYYAAQSFPDQFEVVVGHAFVALVTAGKLFDVANGVVKSSRGKSLNDVTRGFVG